MLGPRFYRDFLLGFGRNFLNMLRYFHYASTSKPALQSLTVMRSMACHLGHRLKT